MGNYYYRCPDTCIFGLALLFTNIQEVEEVIPD